MPMTSQPRRKPLTYSEAWADEEYIGEFPEMRTKHLSTEVSGPFTFIIETVEEPVVRERFAVTCRHENGSEAECLCMSVVKAKKSLAAQLMGEDEDDDEENDDPEEEEGDWDDDEDEDEEDEEDEDYEDDEEDEEDEEDDE